MVKRKERVELPLLGKSREFGNEAPRMISQSTSLRVVNPSRPSWSQDQQGPFENFQSNLLVVTAPLVYKNSTEKSSSDKIHIFPSDDKWHHLATKRTRVTGKWDPSSIELVYSEVDRRYGTINEVVMFSHMVMASTTTDSASICCRLCNGDKVFQCRSATSVSNHVPNIAFHLMTCEGSPLWLKHQIWNNRKHVSGCSVAYSVLLWKRMQGHRIFKMLQSRKGCFARK